MQSKGWLAVLLALLWTVPGLFGHEPWKPDEGYTVGLVHNVIRTGDWVVPRLGDTPFMEKPPVFFITAAAFAWMAPEGLMTPERAMALAAACFLAFMFLFTWLAGKESGGGAAGGFMAMLGLMGSVGLLVRAHSAITDVALWCGFAVAVYGMILSPRRIVAGAFWFGTGAGLTFMAKGFLGPAFLGLAALALPFACREQRRPGYAGFLFLALVFASPWLVVWPAALYSRSPDLFFVWLLDNNLGRFLGPEYGYSRLAVVGTPWKYLLMFPWFMLPLWPPAILAWLREGRRGFAKTGLAYPTLILLAGMVLLSVADTRRDLYLIPLLIPLAVLAGQAGSRLPGGLDLLLRRIPRVAFAAGGVIVWIVWGVWRLGLSQTVQDAMERRAPGVEAGVSSAALFGAIFLTLFCLWLLARSDFRREWGWVWAGGMALVWGVSMALFMPVLEHTRSYGPTFREMFRAEPGAAEAAMDSIMLGESQRAILDVYFNVRPRGIPPGAENAEGAEDVTGAAYLLVQNLKGDFDYSPAAGWKMLWEGARPGDDRERYRLYRREDMRPQ